MSSTDYTNDQGVRGIDHQAGGGLFKRGHWSGANIAAMVLGFLVFAPLGLVVLAWALMGRPVQELPGWVRDKWRQFSGGERPASHNGSDNVVFNEYQQTQYDRIREIKDEIRQRAEAFRAFRADAKRRQDRKEFEEFMSTKPENGFETRA
jgi:hypothetical protein